LTSLSGEPVEAGRKREQLPVGHSGFAANPGVEKRRGNSETRRKLLPSHPYYSSVAIERHWFPSSGDIRGAVKAENALPEDETKRVENLWR